MKSPWKRVPVDLNIFCVLMFFNCIDKALQKHERWDHITSKCPLKGCVKHSLVPIKLVNDAKPKSC